MNEIKPIDLPFAFQIKDQRLFVAPAIGGAVVVGGKLVWDVILSKLITSVIESFGQEVGKRAADLLFGQNNSTSYKELAGKLDVVIVKLDEILFAIRALGPMFRDIALQTIRERLRSELVTLVENTSFTISEIARADSGEKRRQPTADLGRLALQLDLSTGGMLNYVEEGTGRPLGLPTYAAVQAGLAMLLIAYRVLERDGTSQVERAAARFKEWRDFMEAQTAPIRASVEAEVEFFNRLPHVTVMSIANQEEGGSFGFYMNYVTIGGNPNCFFLDAVIEGNAEVPFKFVELRRGADFVYGDDAKFAEVVKNAPQWPYPYNFNNQPPPVLQGDLSSWVVNNIWRFVGELNQRRTAMLQNAEAVRDAQEIMDSLDQAADRLRQLLRH